MKLKILLCLIFFLGAVNPKTGDNIKIGMYADYGVADYEITRLKYVTEIRDKFLLINEHLNITLLTAKQIRNNDLSKYDFIIMPGGIASKYWRWLQPKGREKIKEYIKNGGNYIGICAGGYLARWLKITTAKYSKTYWGKGCGIIKIRPTKLGKKIFPNINKIIKVYYASGPIIWTKGKSVFKFVTDLCIFKKVACGENVGADFASIEKHGNGKTIIISGHFESTKNKEWMLIKIIRYIHENK